MGRRQRTSTTTVASGLSLLLLVVPLLAIDAQPSASGPALEARSDAEDPSKNPDDIVVVGTLADEESVRRDVRLFARKVEALPVDGQIARWNDPVCLRVSGLEPQLQKIVASKINAIAREVGAPVGTAGCRPNMIVMFTADTEGVMAAIERRDARALSSATAQERTILRAAPLPVRWWYTTLTEGSDGSALSSESAALLSQREIVPTSGNERYLSSYRPSLIDSKFRASIVGTAILVDANRAAGVTLDAVASYVAFVALARIRVTANFNGAPSILALFGKEGAAADRLTEWDKAYLTALYSAPVNRTARTQRSKIVGEMVKEMTRDPSSGIRR